MRRSLVCIDFDGVIADTAGAKRDWIRRKLQIRDSNISTDRSSLERLIGRVHYSLMQGEVGFSDTLDASPVAGCISALEQIASEYSIAVVTARHPEKLVWAKRWIEMHGLQNLVSSIHLAVADNPKAKIADLLGAKWLIDNDVRHYGRACSAKFILFGRNARADDPVGLYVAPGWPDVLELVLGSGRGPINTPKIALTSAQRSRSE